MLHYRFYNTEKATYTPAICQNELHALTAFRSFCFDKANSGRFGQYPTDNTFNDAVEEGFSNNGTSWTSRDGNTWVMQQVVTLNGKDRLIQDIRDYIGEGGYVPVTEHGNQPTMNMQAADYNGIELRMRIGREKRRRIEYTEMDEQMLMNVILELFRYQNYCQRYA